MGHRSWLLKWHTLAKLGTILSSKRVMMVMDVTILNRAALDVGCSAGQCAQVHESTPL